MLLLPKWDVAPGDGEARVEGDADSRRVEEEPRVADTEDADGDGDGGGPTLREPPCRVTVALSSSPTVARAGAAVEAPTRLLLPPEAEVVEDATDTAEEAVVSSAVAGRAADVVVSKNSKSLALAAAGGRLLAEDSVEKSAVEGSGAFEPDRVVR